MNFLLRTPFLRLLLALIAGIVTSRFFVLYNLTLLVLSVPAIMVILLSFFVKDVRWSYRLRWGFGAGVVMLVYLAGYWLMHIRDSQLSFTFTGQPVMYRLQLVSPPELKTRSVLIEVIPHPCTEQLQSPDATFQSNDLPRVVVYLKKDSASRALRRDDVLMARVKFQRPDPVRNPEGFDYAAYLRNKGIVATAYVDSTSWKRWSSGGQSSVLHWADRARNQLLAVYRSLGLDANEFAVLAALTLGYVEELEPDLMAHYSASGAMHVLSVSGLHVGVIFMILNMILSLFFRSPSVQLPKTVIMIVALWLYAILTGLSPSVVRASAMFSMVIIGKAFDRHAQIYNTISSTCFFLLIFNPGFLYDVGFQLSYTAVLGIVYFQPKLSPLLPVSNKALKWLWELTSVSLAAQLGTLPLSLYYFNQFPNYFLLTNYIAIPLSTVVIYLAVAYLAVCYIPVISMIAGWMLRQLLELLNSSIEWIHSLPGSVVYFYTGPLELATMSMVLICIVGYAESRKYLYIPLAFGTVLVYSVWQITIQTTNLSTGRMVYFSDQNESHLLLSSGRMEWVHSTDSASFVKQARKYRLKNGLHNVQFTTHTQSWITQFEDYRIAVVNDSTYRRKRSNNPLKIDYLIVQHFRKQRVEELMSCFDACKIIVGAGVSGYYTNAFRQWCKVNGKSFYSVAESGAYCELTRRED